MEKRQSILRSTAVIGTFTGLSRLLGFIREMLMAYFFGTSLAKSAFDVAFRIPNLFRAVFGEGALSAALVPIYTECMAKHGRRAADSLAAKIAIMLGLVLLVLTAAAYAVIIYFLSGADPAGKLASVLLLMRIMLPYTFFICLVALFMGILNSHGMFWAPAASPGLLNVFWIAAVIFVCPLFGDTPDLRIYGVAWGILAAGAAQLFFQVPFLLKIRFNPEVSFKLRDPEVAEFIRRVSPAMLGTGVMQVNVAISQCVAMAAGSWAPAALTYADRLIYLPLGIFATALGSVLLPAFSRQAAGAQNGVMEETLNSSLKGISFVMLPMSVFFCLFSAPIVSAVFQWKGGVFDSQSALLTARAVSAFAPALFVFSIYKVVAPVFYALKDTKTPVTVGVVTVFLNLLLNIASMKFLPDGFQHAGMAASNVIAGAINCGILAAILRGRIEWIGGREVPGKILRMAVAALGAGGAAYLLNRLLAAGVLPASMAGKAANLTLVLSGGIAVAVCYLLLCSLLCPDELSDIISRIMRRPRTST